MHEQEVKAGTKKYSKRSGKISTSSPWSSNILALDPDPTMQDLAVDVERSGQVLIVTRRLQN